jgi:pentatricopeptide repeat protein
MRRCRQEKEWRQLFALYDGYNDWGVEPDKEAYSFMLEVTAETRNFDRATAIFNKMVDDKYKPSMDDYNFFLSTFVEYGDRDKLDLFQEMLLARGYYVAGDAANLWKIICMSEGAFRTKYDTTQMRLDYEALRIDQLL